MGVMFGIHVWDLFLEYRFVIQVRHLGLGFRFGIQVWDVFLGLCLGFGFGIQVYESGL